MGDLLLSGWFGALKFLNQPEIWQAIDVIADEIRHSSIDADRRRDSLAAEAFWRAYVPAREDRDSSKKGGQPLI
jgi:hypothetical protein